MSRGSGKRSTSGGRSRFERLMFAFMGPAQLGDPSAPVRESVRGVQRCETCGAPYEQHEVVRGARLTYTRCPTPEQQG